MEPLTIRLHKNDNVVTAKSDIDINIKIENKIYKYIKQLKKKIIYK